MRGTGGGTGEPDANGTPPAPATKQAARAKKKNPPSEQPALIESPPESGTDARRVFDAITGDAYLASVTAAPGDFARRVTEAGAYPGIDVVAEILRALEWRSGEGRDYRDGRAFLRNWLARAVEKARRVPQPMAAPATIAAAQGGRRRMAPVSESFTDDGPDPYDEILRRRKDRTSASHPDAPEGTGATR